MIGQSKRDVQIFYIFYLNAKIINREMGITLNKSGYQNIRIFSFRKVNSAVATPNYYFQSCKTKVILLLTLSSSKTTNFHEK